MRKASLNGPSPERISIGEMPRAHDRMISRRTAVIAGLAALAAPLLLRAQLSGMRRIGFVAARGRPASLDADAYGGFVRGLRELGYEEGRNLTIEWRFADGKYERLPGLLAELIERKVEVILAASGPAASAAKQATASIPIVIGGVGDPVGLGLVTNLSRPGGNITGVTNVAVEISGKNLELLHVMVPKLARAAVLLNTSGPLSELVLKQIQAAARVSGVSIAVFEAKTPGEIGTAFGAIVKARSGAVIVMPDPLYFGQARQIAELASKHRLPSVGSFREHAEAGGLMSYGQNQAENYRRTAAYVDKILKGARPGELPIEQPTVLELVINRRTAKALGLVVPQELLLRADRVIE